VISVVIPCFNAAATLAAAVESALRQDVVREVIVVDDGSTDSSAELIRSFGEKVIARFGPNRGAGEARNTGASLAQGEWVQFLDSDDMLLPGGLAASLAAGARNDATVVLSRWQEFTERNGRIVVTRDRNVEPELEGKDPQIAFATDAWAPPVAVLYRRELVASIGGFRSDLPVIQDARFLFDAARCGGRFAVAPHVGGLYRMQPESLSRRNPMKLWQDIFYNGKQIEALWTADGPLTLERRQALGSIYRHVAQGFLAAGDDRAFAAFEECRQFVKPPLRLALTLRLARSVGFRRAPELFDRLSR
jgi:glycosyltransferase involved in cell wall biosynthesis